MTEAMVLDDRGALSAPGPRTMLSLAAGLGGQLRHGYEAGRVVGGVPSAEGLDAVVVCGMGGSGVGGDVIRSVYSGSLDVPIVVTKGYSVPGFCGGDTLVLASSFSGNTEETVAAYREVVTRGCRTVTFSSGGELAALSEADQVPHVRLPDDISMPRAALGYLAGALIGVLDAMALIPPATDEIGSAARHLEALAERLAPDLGFEANEAKAMAAWIGDRVPVIWGSEGPTEAAALRWKTQVNENAKGPAWSGILPELDHNEVEGWTAGTGGGYAAIVLRHPGEHPRVGRRVEATIEAVAPSGLEVRQVQASGDGPLGWMLSLAMLGDFVTIYLGVLRGHDPMPIPVLTSLKGRLAE